MPEITPSSNTNGLVVSRSLSLRDRASEFKTAFALLTLIVISSAVAGGLASAFLFTPMFAGLGILAFAFALLTGCLVACCALAGVELLQRNKRKRRNQLLEIQKRLSETDSEDICGELQTLVQTCLAVKDFRAADHYSAVLLKQSSLHPDQRATKLTEFVTSTNAWVSTPEYHESLNYKTVWLYQSYGTLSLTPTELTYSSKRLSLQVDLADVRIVEIKHHPWWLRPNRTDFLSIAFLAAGQEFRVFVTPCFSELDTITRVNDSVKQWQQLLQSAVQKRVAVRAIDKMRAQIPGIESNNEQRVN